MNHLKIQVDDLWKVKLLRIVDSPLSLFCLDYFKQTDEIIIKKCDVKTIQFDVDHVKSVLFEGCADLTNKGLPVKHKFKNLQYCHFMNCNRIDSLREKK